MGVRKLNPVTPGQRQRSVSTFEDVTAKRPLKRLVSPLKRRAGRNNTGRMMVRCQGGGHKRRYRVIDFKRDKVGPKARVASIEYDPNRSARIALLVYEDGDKRYILAPDRLSVGDRVENGPSAPPEVGNCLPLSNIPFGTFVHAVELKPGKGAQLARAAGTYAQLTAKEGRYVTLKLPSGEVRRVLGRCMATIGTTGNTDHMNVDLGKAGRNRWRGKRPKTRGVAMNPVDHPMGGGEGKASGGHPRSRTGLRAKGFKTRKRNKPSDKFIVHRRGTKRR